MKVKLYPGPIPGFVVCLLFYTLLTHTASAQNCRELIATYTTTESRCTATGTIKVNASGGSGNYNYKMQGPVNSDFTSSNLISGLPGGTYTLTVKDIVFNCTLQIPNIVIAGSYVEPRFGITETDVTCQNGSDGTISIAAVQNGRSPYTYSIVAPSTMGIGTTNSTGTFTGLKPGTYSIQLIDSCGAIQTRNISIQNYSWSINSYSVTQSNCTNYNGQLILKDSKGNLNNSGTTFSGYQYGVVNAPGDTSWFNNYSFAFDIGQKRSVILVAKDRCGNVKSVTWNNTARPSVAAIVLTGSFTCIGFNATIYGQSNLTNPQYCLVDGAGNPVPGQPCNPNGTFTNIPYGSYTIKISSSCYDTVITRAISQTRAAPSITGSVTISNYTCTTVTVKATGRNLTNPQFCLYNSAGTQVGGCNGTGIFDNVPYGSYTVKLTDDCAAAPLTVNFTAAKRVRTISSISTKSSSCSTFTATVTGSSTWNQPQYCITDQSGNPIPGISCNNTGIFPNLPYGAYCFKVTDACNDTTVTKCITATKPAPAGGSVNITNKGCNGFTATVTGEANMYNNLYCLVDQAGNPVPNIPCNNTGIFTNIPYGSYCVKSTDGCTNQIYTYCFNVPALVPSAGPVSITNNTCAGFTATVSTQNLFSPTFCLFDVQDHQIGNCNNTGVFNITGYGSYYILTTDGCTGRVFRTPFSVTKPQPSIDANVNIGNQTCNGFTASITNPQNLAGAQYYLVDNNGNTVQQNTTGTFNNVAYGSYCIKAIPVCADTAISRCFTVSPQAAQTTLTSTPSCTYNASDITVKINSGIAPYTVSVYDTVGNLVKSTNTSSTNVVLSGLPSLVTAIRYKIIVAGGCGAPAVQYVTATPSQVTHTYTITPRCPSSISQNGSADLTVAATTNLGGVNVTITQKNFSPVSIGYSNSSGNTFTFSSLDAATYVLTYTFTGCTTAVNDTVNLPPYVFPNLAKSAAYQCDNNSFSIGAAVSDGIGPFTYQVIANTPSTPSISTTPQSSPVFAINNGVQYSLIRLRAVDACGNSALNDVSILPLANTIITSSSDCPYTTSVLSVGNTPNATYTWYKKKNATDSTIIGTGPTYTIPSISVPDTGLYVNKMTVNNGCLTKISYFSVHGTCNGQVVLPSPIELKGSTLTGGANQLGWQNLNIESIQQFFIERSDRNGGSFETIGTVAAATAGNGTSYTYTDKSPLNGSNAYRLRILYSDNSIRYTNIVLLGSGIRDIITVYPNPVDETLYITFSGEPNQSWFVSLYSTTGQILFKGLQHSAQGNTLSWHRPANVKPGLYFLKVNNRDTGESNIYKIMFK